MSAWDDAVNREFVENVWALAQAYESEQELMYDIENFGREVYELMSVTDDIKFKNQQP